MAVYMTSAVSSVFFSWLSARNAKSLSKPHGADVNFRRLSYYLFALFAFAPLFFVSAFRYGISFDYNYTYVPEYYQIAAGNKVHSETGFVLLNKLVHAVFGNVDWLFIITSLIFCCLVFSVIFSRSVDIPMSIFLLIGSRLYFSSFDQIRQYIVIAVFLYALKYIERKNFLKYLIAIGLASTIHTLALAYIPMYFLCRVRLSRKAYLLAASAAVAATAVVRVLYRILAELFYNYYFSANYGINNVSSFTIALTAGVFILGVIYYNRLPDTHYCRILLNLQWIALVVAFTSIGISESYRILALFSYSAILFVPMILKTEQNKYIRFTLTCGVTAAYIAASVYYIYTSGMLPYKTIFAK